MFGRRAKKTAVVAQPLTLEEVIVGVWDSKNVATEEALTLTFTAQHEYSMKIRTSNLAIQAINAVIGDRHMGTWNVVQRGGAPALVITIEHLRLPLLRAIHPIVAAPVEGVAAWIGRAMDQGTGDTHIVRAFTRDWIEFQGSGPGNCKVWTRHSGPTL